MSKDQPVSKKRLSEENIESPNPIKRLKSEGEQISSIIEDISKFIDPENTHHLNLKDKELNNNELRAVLNQLQDNKTIGHVTWGLTPIDEDSKGLIRQIESKIIQNNKEYKLHPNDFIHGLLSSYVYQENTEGSDIKFDEDNVNNRHNEYLKGWKVHRVFDVPDSGKYYAAIYANEETKQMVLAHRGTTVEWMDLFKSDSPLKTDIRGILGDDIIKQQVEAYIATKESVKYTREKGCFLSITGHSLGAWLAELSTYHCYKDFEYYGVKAVTFDSPGTKNSMDKFKSNIDGAKTNFDPGIQLDITTYLSAPNIVNSCNKHIGNVYRVFPKVSVPKLIEKYLPYLEKIPYISNNLFMLHGLLSILGHGLDLILEQFNPQTGKPHNHKQILDWPEIEYVLTEPIKGALGKIVTFAANAIPGVNFITNFIPSSISPFIAKKVEKYIVNTLDNNTILVSIAQVLYDFSRGNINQSQYWKTFEFIEVNNPVGEYTIRQNLNNKEEFSLLYKGHYNEKEVDQFKDILVSDNKGSADWYLSKLKSSVIYTNKSSIIYKQLKEIKGNYNIRTEGGKEYIYTKDISVDELRNWVKVFRDKSDAADLLQDNTYALSKEDKKSIKTAFKKLYYKPETDLEHFIKNPDISDQKLDIIIDLIDHNDWRMAQTAMKVIKISITEGMVVSDTDQMKVAEAAIDNYKIKELKDSASDVIKALATVVKSDLFSKNLLDLLFQLVEDKYSEPIVTNSIITVIKECPSAGCIKKIFEWIKSHLQHKEVDIKMVALSCLEPIAENTSDIKEVEEILGLLKPQISSSRFDIPNIAERIFQILIKTSVIKYDVNKVLELLNPLLDSKEHRDIQKSAITGIKSIVEISKDVNIAEKAMQVLKPLLSSRDLGMIDNLVYVYKEIIKEIAKLKPELALNALDPLLNNSDYRIEDVIKECLIAIIENTENISIKEIALEQLRPRLSETEWNDIFSVHYHSEPTLVDDNKELAGNNTYDMELDGSTNIL